MSASGVRLAPLTAADLPQLWAWINDRDLVTRSAPYRPVAEGAHRAWFDAIQQRSDVVIFGIRLVDDDALIGTCQLHDIHPVHRTAELQIRIGIRQHEGRGFGTEAVRLLLRCAFDDLNLHRVHLHVLATNTGAIRVYEKVGFRTEGTQREAAHIDGQRADLLLMGILRREYQSR